MAVKPHAPMDVQHADPKLRVTAFFVVVVALVAGVALFVVLQRWLTAVIQIPSPAAEAQLLDAFVWAFASVCAAILWLAASLWRSGGRVRRAAQWPLPGARVIRDTPILRGDAAVTRGWVMQGAGAALLLCAACVSVVAWRLFHAVSAGTV